MKWFEGSIAEAVSACKAKNAIFVVFIEGENNESQIMADLIDQADIAGKLQHDSFVSIKLTDGTEALKQFFQIYKEVPVPSLYLIGQNGTPLEVIRGNAESDTLHAKLITALNNCIDTNSTTIEETAALVAAERVDEASSSTTPMGASVSAVQQEENGSFTDAVERAKQLLEKKRQERKQQEEQLEREKELERRRLGQSVQELRRWQMEEEQKQLKQERRREKEEELQARQRVLNQIAQDRADRAARNKSQSPEPGSTEQSAALPSLEPVQRTQVQASNDVARLQFRLPEGGTHTNCFPSSTLLCEVRTYVDNNIVTTFREYKMATTFPRREYTAADEQSSLLALELVPTAVILILPLHSGSVVRTSQWSIGALVWSVVEPVMGVMRYLQRALFGGGGGGAAVDNRGSAGQQQGRGEVRQRSNVHSLNTRRGSNNDENNTWNGNSTQQMW